MLDLILLIFANLCKLFHQYISIETDKYIKIRLSYVYTTLYEGITPLCIKMFYQWKASTFPIITLLRTAFTVINLKTTFEVMNVIANLSFQSVSISTVYEKSKVITSHIWLVLT